MNNQTRLHEYSPPLLFLIFALLSAGGIQPALGQTQLPTELANTGMEEADDEGNPVGWRFASGQGRQVSVDQTDPFDGQLSAVMDSTELEPGKENVGFGNMMQLLDGTPYRGKRVRFRAAVRTAELEGDGKAQLWFRVDRTPQGNASNTGAFDNMGNRPIRNGDWGHYEIVLKVDDDADKILVGFLLIGKGKAWFDDASFEVVDDSTPTTENDVDPNYRPSGIAGANRNDQTALMRAFNEAEDLPAQPFFVSWLWLVAIALSLFVLSQFVHKTESGKSTAMGLIPKFALRFSVAYWLFYSLPMPFTQLLPYIGSKISTAYQGVVDTVVRWTAANIMGIERDLVAQNGSGDTTYAYVNVLICFVLALAVALIWSLVDWRKTDYRWTKDLLRSFIRYVLALTLLGYGLAKIGWAYNQFPEPGVAQLMKTYGDSSPMNLLWTFMGASRPYTIFAGFGEVIGALLLIWRRTTTLGAIVVFGVMLNVVMMNFCYDVPVKQYSVHLLIMAVFLLLPEIPRLTNLLIWNRPTKKVDLLPPYTGSKTIWVYRAIKTAVIIIGFGIPIYMRINQEIEHFSKTTVQPEFFGSYEVEEFKREGIVLDPASPDNFAWKSVAFQQLPHGIRGGPGPTDTISIGLSNTRMNGIPISVSSDESTVTVESGTTVVPQEIKLNQLKGDSLELSGETALGAIRLRLRRTDDDEYRLTGRGFHWINEVPFNR